MPLAYLMFFSIGNLLVAVYKWKMMIQRNAISIKGILI